MKKDILKKQDELDKALKAKTISPEDFAMRQSELKDELKAIDEAVAEAVAEKDAYIKELEAKLAQQNNL